MRCPACDTEVEEGAVSCGECGEPIGAGDQAAGESEWAEVCEIQDVSVLPIVESALRAAGIPFQVQGEEMLGVLPIGRMPGGGGGDALAPGARIFVPKERVEEAEKLLETEAVTDEPE
jgi:Putative prokaryotic signal transducing protein